MTEGYEDGDYLVRVRAQVMTRDDSSGGWVPMGGGGLSYVSVRKRPILPKPPPPPPPPPQPPDSSADLALALQYEYLIFGQRISDGSVVLSCIIKRDFEYNKVMPTFHHWKTGERRFGLTFQAAADARAFDKGVRTAVEELLEVFAEPNGGALQGRCWAVRGGGGSRGGPARSEAPLASGPTRHLRLLQRQQFQYQYRAADLLAAVVAPQQPAYMGMEGLAGSSSPMQIYNADLDDDDVFMTLNLPVERGDSRSSSDSSARGGNGGGNNNHHHHHNNNNNNSGSRHPTPPSEHVVTSHPSQPSQYSSHPHHHLHRISYVSRHNPINGNGGSDTDKQLSSGPSSHPWARGTPLLAETTKGLSPDKDHHLDGGGGGPIGTDNYSYVQLTAAHEYTYPTMDEQKGGTRRDSADSLKKLSGCGGGGGGIHEPLSPQQPPLPVKSGSGRKKSGYGGSLVTAQRARCRYCQEVFTLDLNRKGACDFAPDKMRNLMDSVSCIRSAQCSMYHCMSDPEGDYEQRPCQCGSPAQEGCLRRWLCLGLLSIFVPCLWLYPPLRACHWCCIRCGVCGGQHVPIDHNN